MESKYVVRMNTLYTRSDVCSTMQGFFPVERVRRVFPLVHVFLPSSTDGYSTHNFGSLDFYNHKHVLLTSSTPT